MRPIAELLDFIQHRMSMMAVYQPVIILHLLTRQGIASRTELAQTLSGYDHLRVETWDRVLMRRPKETLVDKHQILSYDKDTHLFRLNFDLSDPTAVAQVQEVCEQCVVDWIAKEVADGKLEEAEILRLYRVLELASRGESYAHTEPDDLIDLALEEFGFRVASDELRRRYPGERIIQQPYDTVGFNVVVGNAAQPIVYGNVKVTQKPVPLFTLSEGERAFSIRHDGRYVLLVVYAVDLQQTTYQLAVHSGAITATNMVLQPRVWQARLP